MLTAIALASCWHGPAAPKHVTVRMAGESEFPTAEPESGNGVHLTGGRCELDGDVAPDLRDAVISFARSNLLHELDQLTGFSSQALGIETPTQSVGCDHPQHRDGYFTEILVTPRTRLGELVVAQRQLVDGQCSWGADIVYCLHVSSGPAGTTVVVEKVGGMLGQTEPPGERIAATPK